MGATGTKDLTTGKPARLLLNFTAPVLLGLLFQQMYNFVDTAIVGRYLGTQALAAVGSTGSVNFLIVGCCTGICSGFGIPIAQAFGARDETYMRRCVANSIYASAFISVVMAVLTALFCRPILTLMSTPADILDDAVAYIWIIFACIPVTVAYNLAGCVLRAVGDSKTPVVYLVVASAVNVALDLFCILVLKMGVAGAALATVISQAVATVGCLWTIRRHFPVLQLNWEEKRPDVPLMLHLTGFGVPMGLQYSITAVGSVVLQSAVNCLGTEAVASMAAGAKVNSLFFCVLDAMGTTMATYAGQNMGAGRLKRVREGLRSAFFLGLAYCALAFAAQLVTGRGLISMFVDAGESPKVVEQAYTFLLWNGGTYVLLLLVSIFRFTIQGMGYTRVAMIAGAFEMAARTLVARLLVPVLGFTGASMANPAAWLAADIFLVPCFYMAYRKEQLRCQTQKSAF